MCTGRLRLKRTQAREGGATLGKGLAALLCPHVQPATFTKTARALHRLRPDYGRRFDLEDIHDIFLRTDGTHSSGCRSTQSAAAPFSLLKRFWPISPGKAPCRVRLSPPAIMAKLNSLTRVRPSSKRCTYLRAPSCTSTSSCADCAVCGRCGRASPPHQVSLHHRTLSWNSSRVLLLRETGRSAGKSYCAAPIGWIGILFPPHRGPRPWNPPICITDADDLKLYLRG